MAKRKATKRTVGFDVGLSGDGKILDKQGAVAVQKPPELTLSATKGWVKRSLDFMLSPEQGAKLARVRKWCADQGYTLDNGSPVASSTDAIRWLIENSS